MADGATLEDETDGDFRNGSACEEDAFPAAVDRLFRMSNQQRMSFGMMDKRGREGRRAEMSELLFGNIIPIVKWP